MPALAPIILRVKDTLTLTGTGAGLSGQGLFRVSTDIVIFKILDGALGVLLRRADSGEAGRIVWALPGDCVGVSEPLEDCAARALGRTGIRDVYLEQLYSFGQPDRNPDFREISVAYYALVSGDRDAGGDVDQYGRWWRVDALPELCLDHERIVGAARERLAAKLEYSTIAFQLMPEQFTLSELQQVYEAICQRPMDKRNFRRRVLALDHLEATQGMRRNGSHRPARLYRYAVRDAIHYLK